MSKKRFVALVLASIVGGSLALTGAVVATTTGGQTAGDCNMAYSTSDVPPTSGTPIGTVTLNKSCVGPVEARFTTELNQLTTGVDSNASIFMSARCIGTGGFADPCSARAFLYATPGSATLAACTVDATESCAAGSIGTRAMNMMFSTMKRGVWVIEVWNNGGGYEYGNRTLTAEAFAA